MRSRAEAADDGRFNFHSRVETRSRDGSIELIPASAACRTVSATGNVPGKPAIPCGARLADGVKEQYSGLSVAVGDLHEVDLQRTISIVRSPLFDVGFRDCFDRALPDRT
jgi:hypothetical protein